MYMAINVYESFYGDRGTVAVVQSLILIFPRIYKADKEGLNVSGVS